MKMYKCVYDYLTSCWNYFLHFQALEKRKLNIGAARSNYDKSWFSTDIDVLDITKFKDWFRILSFLKVDNIVAEHVWEHLSIDEARSANKNCHRFLKRNGVLRLAVPDGYHPSASYIEHVRPGGCIQISWLAFKSMQHCIFPPGLG